VIIFTSTLLGTKFSNLKTFIKIFSNFFRGNLILIKFYRLSRNGLLKKKLKIKSAYGIILTKIIDLFPSPLISDFLFEISMATYLYHPYKMHRKTLELNFYYFLFYRNQNFKFERLSSMLYF